MKHFIWLIYTLVLLGEAVLAQEWSVDSIRDQLHHQARKIHDYSVIVKVSVSMPKFRMPRKKIKVYFRAGAEGRQDQIKLEAKGFAVVPKTGLNFNVDDLFDNFKTISDPIETKEGKERYLILTGTLIPDSLKFKSWDSAEDIPYLTQSLWIDPQRWVITRTEIYVDTSRVLVITSDYGEYPEQVYLPKRTKVIFRLGSHMLKKLNSNRTGPGPIFQESTQEDKDQDFSGHVVMEFSHYQINKGIPDDVFEDRNAE